VTRVWWPCVRFDSAPAYSRATGAGNIERERENENRTI
jgi:hypothetical protein